MGVVLMGVNGPFLFFWSGLNIPESAALGTLAGAALGYALADVVLRVRAGTGTPAAAAVITAGQADAQPVARNIWQTSATLDAEATRRHIETELSLSPEQAKSHIHVEVWDSEVILKGTVHSWAAESNAEQIAWSIPEIQRVDNRLEVVT